MIEYTEQQDFKDALEDMINEKAYPEFNPIREQEVVIFGLMRVQMNSKDEEIQGKGSPIVLKRIPPPFQTLTNGHYLVICDHYFWEHEDEKKKKGALYHALMHIDIKTSDKGTITLGTRKPPVQAWPSEVAKFGAHTEVLMDFREAMKTGANRFAENMKTAA